MYSNKLQTTGRPLKYNDEILNKAITYLNHHLTNKTTIPYIEELALECDLDDERLMEYASKRNPDKSVMFPEFHATIKKLKTLQRVRLLKETIKPYPAGAIFQLKANHNMIETEKRMLVGDKNAEPISIMITEEKMVVLGEE